MSKWKVRGGRLRGSTFWEVFNHNGRFMESFDTHAEAITHADQKARTREVVLPRPDWLTRRGVRLDVDQYRTGIYANSLKYGVFVDMPTQDLRPLALALLAHAERMGQ
ncbi:hypothetical protein ACL1EU_11625 [Corynebacterium striatum]